MKRKARIMLLIVIVIVGIAGIGMHFYDQRSVTRDSITRSAVSSAMRRTPNYQQPSETRPYPKKLNARRDKIIVSTARQRAYLIRKGRLIYEFYVSTGKNVKGRRTPKGNYRINRYRFPQFYSPKEHEGARYAVGWHDAGLYLFHETPDYKNGHVIKSVARDLGRRGSSYGCVHLSRPDAEWFYHHAPAGMRVIIK